MIDVIVNLEDYCDKCMYFDPEIKHIRNIFGSDVVAITCSYQEHCRYMKRKFERAMERKDENINEEND